MRELSAHGRQIIHEVAQRHGFSDDGVLSMLQSVINGNGSMAQFSHPDFAGSGQWMRGGMTMVSDMFNNQLKGRVDSLCSELSNLVANDPDLLMRGGFQSQNQAQQGSFGTGGASLFVPATRENTGQWWPEQLGQPGSTGAQNEVRYAYFPRARRLAINVSGRISVYDTGDHQIGGFSQQQSGGASVTFTSQHGPVSLSSLPIVSGEVTPATPLPPQAEGSATPNRDSQDVFATIEKLAGLLEKGYLSPEEFAEKKKELLSRL